MASKLDSKGKKGSLAGTLLSAVPEAERSFVIAEILRSLRADDPPNVDPPTLDFVASLVLQSSDVEAKKSLLLAIELCIERGDSTSLVPVCVKHSDLGEDLLSKTVQIFTGMRSIQRPSQEADRIIVSYLRFARSLLGHLGTNSVRRSFFVSCLDLLSSNDKQVCNAARDVIFVILSNPERVDSGDTLQLDHDRIWTEIQNLTSSESQKFKAILGYQIWLRWILSIGSENLGSYLTGAYWNLILDGLRRGDSERRKLCLTILKLSIPHNDARWPLDVQKQYDRYCTVFETIVLGRYINQVQECEMDLNLLAEGGDLAPKWLYTLLASAMSNQMQDSNRRFIGNWVMQTNLVPNAEFVEFFTADFLPWATQGQLFVSTLKKRDGVLRCIHGDKLAALLGHIIARSTPRTQLVDIVVDTICRRRTSMFTYAVVYLLEGLGDNMQAHQKKTIASISGLPEVARDYVVLRSHGTQAIKQAHKPISRREQREETAVKKCATFDSGIDALEDIWTDLEYLEYPKKILMLMPSILLRKDLLKSALDNPPLKTFVAEKLRTLQDIAQTKTFLFPPLVSALRTAVLTDSKALGSLDLEGFVVAVAESPPEPTIDLMLEETTTRLMPFSYEHYFGDRRSYGFAAYLDLVGRLSAHQELIKSILDRLLERWKEQKNPPPTVSPWKTTPQLQVILLCCEQYIPRDMIDVRTLLNDLLYVLAIEPLPRYRYLLEWIIVRLYLRNTELENDIPTQLATKDHHSNPKFLASLMKIGATLAGTEDYGEEFTQKLMTRFVPLAASSKVVIRHEAQWQVPVLMDHAKQRVWTAVTENPGFEALDEYIRSLERFSDPPPERKLGRFDPIGDHTLTNLVEGKWFDLDHTEEALTNRAEFIKLLEREPMPSGPEPCMPLGGEMSHDAVAVHNAVDEASNAASSKAAVGPRTSDDVLALQTKGTAYLARTISDPTSAEARPGNLIVIASLVDNPYNLGGLSRVSEIFGASALCLQNQNVLSNKDFLSVSVSSHLHFPIIQLSASGIPAFLSERKEEGFTVVGIEQTDRSVMLGAEESRLPEKCILVVGSEKEGIPALVLGGCDVLVEIPQKGITRSLNVQTAVACVLFEYARQHRKALSM